jgi:hypothetical protein
MSGNCRAGWQLGAVGLVLLLTAGCTIVLQPPIRFRPLADPRPAPPPADALPPGWVANGANPAKPALPPGPPNEQLSVMLQKLATLEDDRKAYSAKLQQTESQLRDKDQMVYQASYEIQESTKQLRKTREEMQRWKQEMDDLRTKVRSLEKENRTTLESVLKALEPYTDRLPAKTGP